MGKECYNYAEEAYNIELALRIHANLPTKFGMLIQSYKDVSSFLAEKVMEFRGNGKWDGKYGSTHNDINAFIKDNAEAWLKELEEEGVRDFG